MAPKAKEESLLTAAAQVWESTKGELQEKDSDSERDGPLLRAEDLKKVAKWLEQTITKFGASASVTDKKDFDKVLKPMAEEVQKAFTAVAGTLLSMRPGAGKSLLAELRDLGDGLADAIRGLGAEVGKPGLATSVGKVTDRIQQLERTSTHNRAAIRRRVLKNLSQLRDAGKELQEALAAEGSKTPGAPQVEEDDDDVFSDFQVMALEPHERQVVEALATSTSLLEDLLKEASSNCIPPAAAGGAESSHIPLPALEVIAAGTMAAVKAVDGLCAHAIGGLEVEECRGCLQELQEAVKTLSGVAFESFVTELASSLEAVKVALDTAESEMPPDSP